MRAPRDLRWSGIQLGSSSDRWSKPRARWGRDRLKLLRLWWGSTCRPHPTGIPRLRGGKRQRGRVKVRTRIHFISLRPDGAFTCSELISGEAEWLHLQLEGVDGPIRGQAQSLLLVAHVREPEGAPQLVQTGVIGWQGLYSRAGLPGKRSQTTVMQTRY